MELITLDFSLETLFPSLSFMDKSLLIDDSLPIIRIEWLKLKDSMNLFYRWYLTCNRMVLKHITPLIPSINNFNAQINNISKYMELVEVDTRFEQKYDILTYLDKRSEKESDNFEKWESLLGLGKAHLKFLFPNPDDLFKVLILSSSHIINFSTLKSNDGSIEKILIDFATFCNIGKKDDKKSNSNESNLDLLSSGIATPKTPMKTPIEKFIYDAKSLTNRWYSHFLILCRVSINLDYLSEIFLVSKRPTKSWNPELFTKKIEKFCKKIEKDTGFRLLLSSELDNIYNKKIENVNNNVEAEQIKTNQILDLISKDLLRTKLTPMDTSIAMDYSLMHLFIGSPFYPSINKGKQHLPYKKNLGRRAEIVSTEFGDQESVKKAYTEKSELTKIWKKDVLLKIGYSNGNGENLVLTDSHGLCELINLIQDFEKFIHSYLKTQNVSKIVSIKPMGLHPFVLFATYSKKQYEPQKVYEKSRHSSSSSSSTLSDSELLNSKLQNLRGKESKHGNKKKH